MYDVDGKLSFPELVGILLGTSIFIFACCFVYLSFTDQTYKHPRFFMNEPYCEKDYLWMHDKERIELKRCWKSEFVVDDLRRVVGEEAKK